MSKTYITIGVDKSGCVYGLELEDVKNGFPKFRRNSLGASTSCAVIRPVSRETLDYLRDDEESVLEFWQMAVHDDRTRLGLKEFFQEVMVSDANSIWGQDEAWPAKDESWCQELLCDEGNPTVAEWGAKYQKVFDAEMEKADENGHFDELKAEDMYGSTFREYVEKLIEESDDIEIDGDEIATWESAGWYPPTEPFAIELAPKEFLEEYYRHLEETTVKESSKFTRGK